MSSKKKYAGPVQLEDFAQCIGRTVDSVNGTNRIVLKKPRHVRRSAGFVEADLVITKENGEEKGVAVYSQPCMRDCRGCQQKKAYEETFQNAIRDELMQVRPDVRIEKLDNRGYVFS